MPRCRPPSRGGRPIGGMRFQAQAADPPPAHCVGISGGRTDCSEASCTVNGASSPSPIRSAATPRMPASVCSLHTRLRRQDDCSVVGGRAVGTGGKARVAACGNGGLAWYATVQKDVSRERSKIEGGRRDESVSKPRAYGE